MQAKEFPRFTSTGPLDVEGRSELKQPNGESTPSQRTNSRESGVREDLSASLIARCVATNMRWTVTFVGVQQWTPSAPISLQSTYVLKVLSPPGAEMRAAHILCLSEQT
jgi:hypothetical protein